MGALKLWPFYVKENINEYVFRHTICFIQEWRSSPLHPKWRSPHKKQLNEVVYEHFAKQGMGPSPCTIALRAVLSGPMIIHTAGDTPCVCLCFSAFHGCVGRHEFNSRLPNANCQTSSSSWMKKSWPNEIALETRCTNHGGLTRAEFVSLSNRFARFFQGGLPACPRSARRPEQCKIPGFIHVMSHAPALWWYQPSGRSPNGVFSQCVSGHLWHRSSTSWAPMRSDTKSSNVACDWTIWTLALKRTFSVTTFATWSPMERRAFPNWSVFLVAQPWSCSVASRTWCPRVLPFAACAVTRPCCLHPVSNASRLEEVLGLCLKSLALCTPMVTRTNGSMWLYSLFLWSVSTRWSSSTYCHTLGVQHRRSPAANSFPV